MLIEAIESRARAHRALGDPSRLAIVDALRLSDRSPTELGEATRLDPNLLAFHLKVLERAGLVERRRSAGDGRRRYVRLRGAALEQLLSAPRVAAVRVLFVCTHNSARSVFAAGLWRARTGRACDSAGHRPARRVHPLAVDVARAHGVDLAGARPRGYSDVGLRPDLVVSVCDRALEAGVPFDAPRLHWSVPDPGDGDRNGFEAAFDEIAQRVGRLAAVVA